MKFLAILGLILLVVGCQSTPQVYNVNPKNSASCAQPRHLNSVQKRLCAQSIMPSTQIQRPILLNQSISNISMHSSYNFSFNEINVIKDTVASGFIDPQSAIFGNIKGTKLDTNHIAVCGIFNAKNPFGNYVGRRPFLGVLYGSVFELRKSGTNAVDSQAIINECQKYNIIPAF